MVEECIKAVLLVISQCSAYLRDFELTPPEKKIEKYVGFLAGCKSNGFDVY